jgi:hypothetical protein
MICGGYKVLFVGFLCLNSVSTWHNQKNQKQWRTHLISGDLPSTQKQMCDVGRINSRSESKSGGQTWTFMASSPSGVGIKQHTNKSPTKLWHPKKSCNKTAWCLDYLDCALQNGPKVSTKQDQSRKPGPFLDYSYILQPHGDFITDESDEVNGQPLPQSQFMQPGLACFVVSV